MSHNPSIDKARVRVLEAAMRWHHWLTMGASSADYHKYCAAFKRLQRACIQYKNVTGKAFLKKNRIA